MLLNVVKKEEERYVGIDEKHSDGVFEKYQVENELLKCLLKAFEYEKGIAGIDRRISQVLDETEEDSSLLNYVMFDSIHRSVSEYVTAIKELENNLLFESKFAGIEHEKDIAEGDAYPSIQEVRLEVVSRAVSRKIPRAISGAAFGKISRVKVEIEARKAKE